MKHKLQKIVVVFLIFGQAALMPGMALAVVSTATGSLNPVPINDTGSAIANSVFDGVLTPALTAHKACVTKLEAFEATDSAARTGFSFSAIIGGGGALAAQLVQEKIAYNTYLLCEGIVLATVSNLTAPNTYTGTVKQQAITQLTSNIDTYRNKVKTVDGRLDVANQNIWKALLITVLINTTKAVADTMVNRLVNNYKISNIKAYADSVATLMYDNQYIRDNFPDAQGQMMARAILTNPIFRNQIQPGMFMMAENSLGYNCAEVKSSDPNFYNKVAACGSAEANPYYLQTAYVSGVDQARALSLASANLHIGQGNGYKAPVTCNGSLIQQNQIDLQTKAASDRIANRQGLLNDLQRAQTLGQPVKAGDIKQAQADLDAAKQAYQNLPFAVTGANSVSKNAVGGGSNTEGNIAIKICEAVSSPAILVNQGIDAMFKSISTSMSQYNSNNLPGFLSAIGSMATQIGSRMILGGITGDQSYKINESQLINQAVSVVGTAAIQTLGNHAQENIAKGIDFEAQPNPSVPNGYELNWQVVETQNANASYVTITGPGIADGSRHLPLSGSYAVTTAAGGTYRLNLYSAGGLALATATVDIGSAATQNAPAFQSYISVPGAVNYGNSVPVSIDISKNKVVDFKTFCPSVNNWDLTASWFGSSDSNATVTRGLEESSGDIKGSLDLPWQPFSQNTTQQIDVSLCGSLVNRYNIKINAAGTALNNNASFSYQAVAGAFAGRPLKSIRGPVGIAPRGPQ